MGVKRNERWGIEDRWTKRVKDEHGRTVTVDSDLKGKVARWRVRWVNEEGKECTKSFKRKPDAQQFLNDIAVKVQTGEYAAAKKGGELFSEVAEQWFMTKQHRKPKTVSGYRELLDNLVLPRWGDIPLRDISYEGYLQWLGGLATNGSRRGTPLSASRIIQAHQCAGAVLKYAVKTGKLQKNVAADISRSEDLPELVERERVYLGHEELLRLAEEMGRYKTQTLILGYCGLRFGESVALRRRHIGNAVMTLYASATYVPGSGIVESTTKTKKSRKVPIPLPIWKQLKKELPSDPDALVFPSYLAEDRYMPIEEYRRALDKAKKKAGIDQRLTPHGLRHTAASLAISAGANIKVVQRLLGHASAAMTLDRYGHLYSDDLTAVADSLGKAMESTAVSLRYYGSERKDGGLLETAS